VIREEKVDRLNSVILLRIPVDSDNGIVNSQVTKSLILFENDWLVASALPDSGVIIPRRLTTSSA